MRLLLAFVLLPALAAPAWAEVKPKVPCLTCPRITPACWMMVYRWTDYNLRSGPGNALIITDGPPPTRPQLIEETRRVMESMPKGMNASLIGTSRVDCPDPIKAEARKP